MPYVKTLAFFFLLGGLWCKLHMVSWILEGNITGRAVKLSTFCPPFSSISLILLITFCTVLALVIVPVISVAVRRFGRFLRELSHQTQAAAAVASSIAEVCTIRASYSYGLSDLLMSCEEMFHDFFCYYHVKRPNWCIDFCWKLILESLISLYFFLESLSTAVQESFGAIRTVRSFAQEPHEISRYGEKVNETLKLGLKQAVGAIPFILM